MKTIVVKTNNLLSDPSTPAGELEKLEKELESEMEFGLALKVIERLEGHFPKDLLKKEASDDKERAKIDKARWIQQRKAICTYKNEDEHVSVRLPKALAILDKIGLGDKCDPETLGLAGAVYKRLWEYRGRIEDIQSSLAFYLRAWERPEIDKGYGGINAAFILDILASQARKAEKKAGTPPKDSKYYGDEAKKLRIKRMEELPGLIKELEEKAKEEAETKGEAFKKDYWLYVTLAEVYMGLKKYEEAGHCLKQAYKLTKDIWKLQTTVRQLISIVKMQGIEIPGDGKEWHPAWKALQELTGENTLDVIRAHRGKVGLALSGGGFRASLYHLGALAALAEADILSSVEVISTVSGGSIVGAYYYLELQRMLESTEDKQLTRDDYIILVQRVQHNFLCAVQKNLRVRAMGDFWANLKITFSRNYTRSIKLSELYQKHIFNNTPGGPCSRKSISMKDLLIGPKGEGPREEFNPLKVNWRRRAKVPVLLINTTSLNSGHNFHFTAKFMGEPPGLIGDEIDMNARFRRVYYEDIEKESLRLYPLGQAVAASACVSGLFEPLELKGLYPGYHVQLVDGGVHDNQGVQGLLDESCSIIICSDASGQMDDQVKPQTGRLGVLLRSNSIFMDRIREAEYDALRECVDSRSLEGLLFVHLKKDLDREPIAWVGSKDKFLWKKRDTVTPYGIDRDIQSCLADLRTDLDSFTDVEAYALMMSGYAMTRYELKELAAKEEHKTGRASWKGFMLIEEKEEDLKKRWPFLCLCDIMRRDGSSTDQRRIDLEKQLKAGKQTFLKILRLSPVLLTVSILIAAAAAGAGIWWLAINWGEPFFAGGFTPGEIIIKIGLPLAITIVPALAWLFPMRTVKNFIFNLGLICIGSLLTGIHLFFFDKLFLRRGSLRRLMRLE
ncbi:MAG: patatin-like phospholipase family protein [Nitrospirae bacterium]|nr:patatin-like phospholipase family protein [Nitrospirota bacterium]